jgi:hypothetical protein
MTWIMVIFVLWFGVVWTYGSWLRAVERYQEQLALDDERQEAQEGL